MKILQLHSDYIEYNPVKKETKNAEDVEIKPVKLEDIVVLFTCIESEDTSDVGKRAIDDAKEFMKNLKVNKILLYPYAHLSNDLASPDKALGILKSMEDYGKELGIDTFRAPFGWAKQFSISVKGHPLAEQSRNYSSQNNQASAQSKAVVEKEKKELSIEQKRDKIFQKSKMTSEELPENDHRRLGQQLDLFSFHQCAPGMPFFHNNGMIVLNELMGFLREEQRKTEYTEVRTPLILNRVLWEISGHWDKYRENMYFTVIDEGDYGIKPMNCPGGIMIFKNDIKSYRDLPLRAAEFGLVHRHELSGVLSGLFRVRSFTQDDAHIYMTEKQIKNEILGVIKLIDKFYKTFGFEYKLELSTRPEKSIGTDEQWIAAEKGLKDALEASGLEYVLNPGDGAFYGPKIDFHVKDAMGRTWQCGTIQLDMTMPEKFDINYVGEDNKSHKVVMIHRTVMGSLERFMGILVEHFEGKFPVWLAPTQVILVPISEKNNKYASKIKENLEKRGIRVSIDLSSNTMDYKIRDAQLKKIPYMVVVGDKEEEDNTISVRNREGKVTHKVKATEFIKNLKKRIENKSLEV